jgi:hypothetical protein
MLRKIEALVANVEQPFQYGNVFTREVVRGVERLRIALDDGHQAFIRSVASRLTGLFQLLYVFHTSRTDAQLGRYESPDLNAEAVGVFFWTDSADFFPRTGVTISGFGRTAMTPQSSGIDTTSFSPTARWTSSNQRCCNCNGECGQARRRRFLIRTCITTMSNGTPRSAQYSRSWTGASNRFANRMCSSAPSRVSLHCRILDGMVRTTSG